MLGIALEVISAGQLALILLLLRPSCVSASVVLCAVTPEEHLSAQPRFETRTPHTNANINQLEEIQGCNSVVPRSSSLNC